MRSPPATHSVVQMKTRVGSVYLLISMVAVAAFGGMAAAPNANAVGTWAAISWSPKEGVSGTGDGATEGEAVGKAMSGCTGNGGTECRTVISAENACIAVAAYVLTYAGGQGPTLDAARSAALAQLGNATIRQAMCGGNPGVPERQATPTGADTDLDGVNDGDEVKNGTNPLLFISN